MKKLLILTIDIYQGFISAVLKNILGVNRMCRFSPTCSEYAKTSIGRHGIFRGIKMSTTRILKCQPFFSKSASGGN